jgi:hypothetical protein
VTTALLMSSNSWKSVPVVISLFEHRYGGGIIRRRKSGDSQSVAVQTCHIAGSHRIGNDLGVLSIRFQPRKFFKDNIGLSQAEIDSRRNGARNRKGFALADL